jgi:hypothetical protein
MFMLLFAEITEFVFPTVITAGAAAFAAGLDTVFAEVLATDFTAAGTAQTNRVLAHRTICRAIITVVISTFDTGVPVFPVHLPAAVIAGHSIPFFQPDIGTVGVIGS